MKYRNSILSIKEREEVLFHLVQEKKPHVEFVLTEDDFLKIKKLEIHLQLGYAIQLLYLRVKGLNVGSLYERIPENVVKYVASQLHCNTIFLEKYWKIKNTSNRHFQEIYQSLEFSKFQYTNELKNKIVDKTFEAFNYHSFDGKDTELDDILKDAQMLPMMSEYNFVLVKDYPIEKSSNDIKFNDALSNKKRALEVQ